MSFFERAKAAANDLAAKADAEMKKAGISTPGASAGTGTYGAPGAPAPRRIGGRPGAARPRGAGLPRGDRPAGVHRRPRAGDGDPARARVVGAARPLTVAPAGAPGPPPPPPAPGVHSAAATPAAGGHPAGLDTAAAATELGLGEQRPQHVGPGADPGRVVGPPDLARCAADRSCSATSASTTAARRRASARGAARPRPRRPRRLDGTGARHRVDRHGLALATADSADRMARSRPCRVRASRR